MAQRWLPPVLGVIATLIAFELALRPLYSGAPTWVDGLGWSNRSVALHRAFSEGGAVSHWDARGVRIVPGDTPPGPAVLAAGDSMTQASQVSDRDVYTARLQRELGMPVLNAGRDAATLADAVYAAPYNLAHFDVAWTIVQVIPLDFEQRAIPGDHAAFTGANAIRSPRHETGRLDSLRRHSALAALALQRYAIVRDAKMPPLFLAADADPQPTPPRIANVEAQLDLVRAAYRNRVTVFFVPDFLPPPTNAEERFTRWCADRGASCVNLRAAFAAFRARGRAPTGFADTRFGEGHLNPEGHAAAAALLADELRRLHVRALH